MKKIITSFAFIFALALLFNLSLTNDTFDNAKADDEQYEFIEQTNAIDFVQNQFNATADFETIDYKVQDGDYLAIDIEGYNNYQVFKIGFNGSLLSDGADYCSLNTSSFVNEWTAEMKYGRWTFTKDGRGIVLFSLSEYFPSLTDIESFNLLLSDNKNESFTIHDIFITNDTTQKTGTSLLNVFNSDGSLVNEKVSSSDVEITGRKSAKGFQSNKSMFGGVVIKSSKTRIEIETNSAIVADGGYVAYDISYNGEFAYFTTSYLNVDDEKFNSDYYVTGKSLSKHNQLSYDQFITEYGWYKINQWNVTGTVLERIQTSAKEFKKIIINCDFIQNEAQLVLSNFYYISKDQKTIIPLVDFCLMSDEVFLTKVTGIVNDEAASIARAPKEMKIFYLADSISEDANVTTNGYTFTLNPVKRNNKIIKFVLNDIELGLYEIKIDYIAHVPWAIINIDGTQVHNGTMEKNEVVFKGETSFSLDYSYEKFEEALTFLDNGILSNNFDENKYEDLLMVKTLYNSLSNDAKKIINASSIYDASIFDLSNKAVVEIEQDQYIRTGLEIKPNMVVKLGNHNLTIDTDYIISYTNNVLPGTATININFTGIFNGKKSINFTIVPISYRISFNAGEGGSGSMDSLEIYENTAYTLPDCAFAAPNGKYFAGWKINNEGDALSVGSQIVVLSNIELVAQWELITYVVSFDSNGGTGEMAIVPNQLGEYILPECEFTAPEGKHFAGWKVNGEGELLQPGAVISISSNTILVGQWENNPKRGCGGNIMSTSITIATAALLGTILLIVKKKQTRNTK